MAKGGARPRALAFILVTILVDTIGLGIIIPVMPELIMELTGEGLGRAAIHGGRLLFVYALMQFFFAPVLGNLSDRFGRRPVLLVSLAAFGIDYVVMGFATSLVWLFVARAVAGVAGATFSTANAYVADVTSPEERAQSFGLLGAAWGVGFILGPVIGGLLGELGPRVPFFAAGGLAMLNVLYGLVVLPESLPREQRRAFSWRRANPVGMLGQMRHYPVVLGLFGALLLHQIAHDANPSVWTYYTMLKFDWTERDIGLSMGAVGIGVVLVQAFLIRAAIPRLGEERASLLGFTIMGLGYLGFGLATQGWMMLAAIVPFSLGCIGMPALRSILSKQVPEDAQGELQGGISSVMSLTAIGAPILMTELFGFFTSEGAPLYLPGAPFLTAALMMAGCVAIVATTLRSDQPAPAALPKGGTP